ncbi:transposase [Anabaenopsis tanganyikae CS-531]|uniref:Transposase n=2 Tax=Anabaenopsis TaxID=110103 RepID=A0ABT6KAJ6_9CYAN|nr:MULTISPECIES: transposase [Anabaenopsis]MDB9538904.1 transposase [Anabaenopsis arnoldii]MDH6091192.1 transposase [Anabaenopsis arnoldii]MDH6104768.1 transposase [Anabaenopsis tanganyikae CS-531]
MKAYSLDFRQKIFDTYLESGISQRQLAKRFCVSLSFVEKLLKQYRETQSIAPKRRTKQTPTKLNSQQLNILQEIVEAKNDATLGEIRLILQERTGITIGISTVDRMLQKMEISLKKNIARLRKRDPKSSIIKSRILASASGHTC